ncbi:MAG: hypothetical protein WCJ37_07050 [Syntrophus sp. (in: bacteria)]
MKIKCDNCGCEYFVEFAKCDTIQKCVTLSVEANGAVEASYETAGLVECSDGCKVTGYQCQDCNKEYGPEFGGHFPISWQSNRPLRIQIGLEGGLVTGVSSNAPLEVLVLDYDTDCGAIGDEPDVIGGSECFFRLYEADVDPDRIALVFDQADALCGEQANGEEVES